MTGMRHLLLKYARLLANSEVMRQTRNIKLLKTFVRFLAHNSKILKTVIL